MRTPRYLSPSALKTFEKNREEYYLKYLATNRPPRLGQTEPMAAGSAFDGYIKSFLYYRLFGHYGDDNEYEAEAIFEAQVEPQNRDWARPVGQYLFERYSQSGALSDMLTELSKSITDPRFEFSITGKVESKVGDIPITGKPDIFFINEYGARVIWDWKVNGFCSRSSTSPAKGYTKSRDAWPPGERRASRNNQMAHPKCNLVDHLGIMINGSMNLEDCNTEWADQLATYAWLLGEAIGSEQLISGIDQLASCGTENDLFRYTHKADGSVHAYPYIRIASQRAKISAEYQRMLHTRYTYMWKCIKSGHLFTDMSLADNNKKIDELENRAKTLSGDDPFSRFLNRSSRSQ